METVHYKVRHLRPEIPSGEADTRTLPRTFKCLDGEWFRALCQAFGKCEGKNDHGGYTFFKLDEGGPLETVVFDVEVKKS